MGDRDTGAGPTRRQVLGGLVVGAAALSGCFGARREARRQGFLVASLEQSAEAWWDAVRWGSLDDASPFALDRALWVQVLDALLAAEGTYNVTDVEILRVEVRQPEGLEPTGDVEVRYELTTLPSLKLEKRVVLQPWVRHEGTWRLKLTGDEAALFKAREAD